MSDPGSGVAANVHPLFLVSLQLDLYHFQDYLSSATGFLVSWNGAIFLVSNWHVFTGLNPDTGTQLLEDSPNRILVYHHVGPRHVRVPGVAWNVAEEWIYDETGRPRWLEHPKRDRKIHPPDDWDDDIDIGVLRLQNATELHALNVIDLNAHQDYPNLTPGTKVALIGYPFRLSHSGYLPFWKTGHIASDISLHNESPRFYVDATVRPSMSGSPVFLTEGSHVSIDTDIKSVSDCSRVFLGVYSGRPHYGADIGVVWWRRTIAETLEGGVAGTIVPYTAEGSDEELGDTDDHLA